MSKRVLSLVAVVVAAVASCRGPDPMVMRHQVEPPAVAGDPYRVVVTVQNLDRDQGNIEVRAHLKARETGETTATGGAMVALTGHETLDVTIELRPDQPAPYDLAVEAKYP